MQDKTNRQDNWKRYCRTTRVACLDYTQVREWAASQGMRPNLKSFNHEVLEGARKKPLQPFRQVATLSIVPGAMRSRLAALLVLASTAALAAQDSKPLDTPPGELVREAVANEVAAANNTTIKHMFRSRKQTPKGSQTKLFVETSDAIAAMLIAVNDQPLTPQQEQAETDHLAWLMDNPDQLRKKKAREKEDAERTVRIMKALPDAFLYVNDGTVNGAPGLGREGAQLVRLKFTPNPSYVPPTRVEQVLAGMQGYLLIDPTSRRLARIDGTLFNEVTFGWGIIGHLDKGGHFRVQQAEVSDGTWGISEMSLNITGKILFFKTISMVSDEVFSDFHRVPDQTTFASGVELLKAEQARLAQEKPASGSAEAKTPR